MADALTDRERNEFRIYKDFFETVENYPKNAAPPYSGLDYIKARIYDTRYQLEFLDIEPVLREIQLKAARPVRLGNDKENV